MATAKDWQGKVGDVWAAEAVAMDRLLMPPGNAAIAALGDVAQKRVLDLGCGAGQSSRKLFELGADVTGIDISPSLLEAAKAKGPDAIAYHLKDAQSDPLDGPYDALYARFGSMFFDDPVGAWRHIRAAMKPRAHLALAVWQALEQNEWAYVPLNAASGLVAATGPTAFPPEPGPFAWADPDYFTEILTSAGWSEISHQAIDFDAEISMGDDPDPVDRAIRFATRSGPLASRMKALPEDRRAEIKKRLIPAFQEHLVGDKVRLGGKAWLIEGRA